MLDRRRFIAAAGAAAAGSIVVAGCGRKDDAAARPPGVPLSTFDRHSTAEQVTAGIDLAGRTALVTGATSGLGLETMRVLALRGAHVIGTSGSSFTWRGNSRENRAASSSSDRRSQGCHALPRFLTAAEDASAASVTPN